MLRSRTTTHIVTVGTDTVRSCWRFFKKIPRTKAEMNYIKVILFLNIELIFPIDIIHSQHLNKYSLHDECSMYNLYKPDIVQYNLMGYTVYLRMHTELDPNSVWISSQSDNIQSGGQVDMNIHVSLPNSSILTLYIQDLEIKYVKMRHTNDWTLIKSSYCVKEFNLIIFFKDSMPPDNYTLSIGFEQISDQSISNSTNFFESKLGDRSLIITQLSRQLFPYWRKLFNLNLNDNNKVIFNISVLHNINYSVLSNAKVSKNLNNDNSSLWSIFEPISMADDSLVIILLPRIHNTYNNSYFTNHIITKWCKTDTASTLSFAQSIINDVTLRLFQYTNKTHPNSKIDHVVIWDAPSKITAHSYRGIIIYRESEIIYEKKKDLLDIKLDVMTTIISKVARQWIGGLITPQISDPWISQSFAKFFELEIVSQMLGERYEVFLLMQFFHLLLVQDDGKSEWLGISLPPVFFWDPDDLLLNNYYKNAIYKKGALLLRMLQYIMGKETFRNGVIQFLNKNKSISYRSVTTDDLWSAMQTALDAASDIKVDIKNVMDTYVKEQSYPVVIVTRNETINETIITQQSYQTFDMLHDVNTPSSIFPVLQLKSPEWRIPITWATQTYPKFNDLNFISWLEPKKSVRIRTDPNDWIILNLKQTGYYRVHYDRTSWEKIGNFLNNEDYETIHVLNRARFIYDICEMFKNGRIDWALFTSITSYLSRETNYIVWMSMIECLSWKDMITYFHFPENKEHQVILASYFDNIVLNILNIKNESSHQDDIIKLVKWHTVDIACQFGNLQCRQIVHDLLKVYFTDPTTHQIPPQSEHWMFCYGLKTANDDIWHELLWKLTREKKSICPLACTDNHVIIMDYLRAIVKINTSTSKTTVPDFIYCVINFTGSIWIDQDQVFSFLLDEFVSKQHLYIDDITSRLIEAVHTEDQLDKISANIKFTYGVYTYFLYEDKIEKRKKYLSDVRNKFDNQQHKIY